MSRKNLRKSAILFVATLIIVFGLLPAGLSAQALHLKAGTTTKITSDQATCEHEVSNLADPPTGGLNPTVAESGCEGGRLTLDLDSGLPFNVFGNATIEFNAHSQLVVQFQVDTQPGAPDVSFLPVQITIPVTWKGTLNNNNLVPNSGPLAPAAAFSDINGELFLALGQPGDPRFVGTTLASNNFMGASHGGILGCISLPKTAVQAALLVAKCARDVSKREEGNGTIYLSGIIQTGQTYDLVLQLQGDIFTQGNYNEQDGVNFQDDKFGTDPFGLFWTDAMTITIGTDFQSRIAGLQNEIVDLQNQLSQLRQEFKTHTHVYLTGKGIGQNNTKVNTGPPTF